MNGGHAISRRATMGYLGAALATSVSAKWAVSWGTATDADLLEIPLGVFVSEAPGGESDNTGMLAAIALDPGPVGMTGVRAYVCNGADVAEWFTADIAGNDFSMTSEVGATLEGSIGPAGITGRFRALSGAERSLELRPAPRDCITSLARKMAACSALPRAAPASRMSRMAMAVTGRSCCRAGSLSRSSCQPSRSPWTFVLTMWPMPSAIARSWSGAEPR